jgi:hypothetical protein
MGFDAETKASLKRQALQAFGFTVDEGGQVLNIDREPPETVARIRNNLIVHPAEILRSLRLSLPENWVPSVQPKIDHDQNGYAGSVRYVGAPVRPKITAAQMAKLESVGYKVPPEFVPENCGTLNTVAVVGPFLDQAIENAEKTAAEHPVLAMAS